MYIADKTLEFFVKILLIIFLIIIIMAMVFNVIEGNLNFEKIFLSLLEKFVDFIKSLFVISHDALRKITNNFELP